jgi:hypothetical protein
MKSITKLSVIAAFVAILSTSAALADNTRLENRLTRQHTKAIMESKLTTVALFNSDFGIGSKTTPELRFQVRSDAHGGTISSYVPAE